jgi:subtilisin family serine protease
MRRSIQLLWLLAGTVWVAGAAPPQTKLIVETESPDDMARISAQYGVNVVQTVREKESNIYVVATPSQTLGATAAAIQADVSVRSLSSDDEVEISENQTSSNRNGTIDPITPDLLSSFTISYFGSLVRGGYVQQSGTALIELAQTQQQFPTGNNIVAVIDTGVDPNHPALANVLVPGYDFVHNVAGFASELADLNQSTVAILDQSTVAILDQKNSPLVLNQSTVAILDQSTVAILDGQQLPEDFGHGTMVSGLIHLVAPTASIMPLKAFQSDGTAQLSNIVAAIYFAVDHGARVINMSFSTTTKEPVLQQAIAYATSHGVITIASAGNQGREMTVYPAGFQGVIGVGSTNKNDLRSPFSNYDSDAIRLAAPGEALVTTYPGNNYAAVWGTSFSSALVSGASALVTDVVPLATSGYAIQAFDQGPHIHQDIGDARLNLFPTLQYCLTQPYTEQSESDE